MAEYIERELLLNSVRRLNSNTGIAELYTEDVLDLIRDFPEADVAPVRHGRWITTDTLLGRCCVCSVCGSCPTKEYKYCPYCGTRCVSED